jgi:hypothetical protein
MSRPSRAGIELEIGLAGFHPRHDHRRISGQRFFTELDDVYFDPRRELFCGYGALH